MSKQHIEIDSTYRNRVQFKNPSEFEIDFNTPMTEPHLAIDPVSNEAPVKGWKNSYNGVSYIDNKFVNVDQTSTDNLTIDIRFTTTGLRALSEEDDYYNNIVVTFTNESRRIVKYKYLVTNSGIVYAQITLDYAFSVTPLSGNTIYFNNPNILSNIPSYIFVPGGGNYDNTYVGYYLYDDLNTVQTYYKIVDYDSVTHRIQVDGNITTLPQHLSIRKSIPTYRLDLGVTNITNGLIPSTMLSNINITENVKFIRNTTSSNYGRYYKITSIKDNGDIVFDFIGDDTSSTRNDIIPVNGVIDIEFLSTSYDNNHSLQFSGSIVSQTQLVCHEIELLHIILPNKVIKHHRGGRVSRHPYIYVELSNISAGQNRNNIYSNNPHARKALFKCSIKDICYPVQSPYVKLDGGGMIQTIKFKPTDQLYFKVILSDGTLFEVEDEETFSPLPPNPSIQINAMFSIRKV